MPASNRLSKELRSHPLVFVAAVAVAGILIYPFIIPLILSVITVYVFYPIVKRLEVHTRSYHIALGILVIIIGLPIIFAISYLYTNAVVFFQDIAGFGDKLNAVISAVSDAITGMGFGAYAGYFLSAKDITSKITEFAISLASDFVQSIPFFLLEFVIYLYATYHFMRNGQKIIDFIKAYASSLPAEDEHFISSILRGLKRSFDVLFVSYITISLIVTGVSFIGYSIFGAPHAFLLAIITGLFCFLPVLGVWMVYVPVAAYMYSIGNIFAAAGIMVFGVVVLTIFIPLILQPYLGAKKSGVSALSILLGFFSGSIIFGAKGLLLGPILFVSTETIIVEYMRYRVSEKEGLENSVSEA
ncbi:MAG: AI-2E family transporter [Euryarchaeota archaeon]|nr:AI-2E family transporter [Euryarchaeota archaeon]MCG2728123.1 AI-2E family transporter [Candidatus Methanoperedenaceae archaeon]